MMLTFHLKSSLLESVPQPCGEVRDDIDWTFKLEHNFREEHEFKVRPNNLWTEVRKGLDHLKERQFTRFARGKKERKKGD